MNFDIFFALIGIPALILITALICYVHVGMKEEVREIKRQLKEDVISKRKEKGGISS